MSISIGDTRRFKNLQSAARRRGLSLRREQEGFVLISRFKRMYFEDISDARDELRGYSTN